MPMYTYQCTNENCNHYESKLVKISERETMKFDCEICKTSGTLKFTAFIAGQKQAGIVFKGRGYHEGY